MDTEHARGRSSETHTNETLTISSSNYIHTPTQSIAYEESFHKTRRAQRRKVNDEPKTTQQAGQAQNRSMSPGNEYTPKQIELQDTLDALERKIKEFCKNVGNPSDKDTLQHAEAVLGLLNKNGARHKEHALYQTRRTLVEMVDQLRNGRAEMNILEKRRVRQWFKENYKDKRKSGRMWARYTRQKHLAAQEARRARETSIKAHRTLSMDRREDYFADERMVNEEIRRQHNELAGYGRWGMWERTRSL
ncbi:hypothetical protein BJX70DRAFT_396859 [Aspergillus crustosus]